MKIFRSRIAATLAILGALSLSTTPSLARDRYDDWGRHHRHHRSGGGIDGGSLLAGLLVGGAAVAIATSMNKKSAQDRGDDVDGEPAPYRYPGGPVGDEPAYGEAPAPMNGAPGAVARADFGMAVDACSEELERGGRQVASVEGVRRMGERYSVEGKLEEGVSYACSVDDGGHIRSVAVNGRAMI